MNIYLVIAAILSAVAALLHVGCIIFGASWYRFFGAGEEMAALAEQGSIAPTIITSFIALILSVWSAYALSGAGIIRKLPLIRTALILITSIYLLRGIGGLFFISNPGSNTPEFMFWSSSICIVYGLFYLIGLKQKWSQL
jgi:hypothetical protein